ncbi:MAG: aminoacetone oxidase family FAD-binding enzyme [Peptoniphilus sp.]|nr:aminoacetone oxidase family FAD-binding enzyme [Peptoniphilus sp.]MDY3119124.1 aminoacetone oxidase family FAD-binding enzyme [Peptoniphilus sp.]
MEIAIVGGGVSGLAAGCLLAEGGHRVAIYERKNRVGKKLLVTGNGRANVSNGDLSRAHWHSESPLPFDPGTYFSPAVRRRFFEEMGIDLVEEERGKLYPSTLQARTVLNALRRRFFSAGGVEVVDTCIEKIEKAKDGFRLASREKIFFADRVIVATGGMAMPQSGADGKGYALLQAFGHKKTRIFPGISALVCDSPYLKHLNGTKVEGAVNLFRNGEKIASKTGEILLAKDGISGPPVLDLARTVGEEKGNYRVSFPMINHLDQLGDYRNLLEGRSYLPAAVEDFLDGILSNKWVHVVLKECGLKGDEGMDQLPWADRNRLLNLLFAFTMPVTGVRGFDYAQVTCGGMALDGFSEDLESAYAPGLYAAGEVLDVDGDCGGYNIHWAMASAFRIAQGMEKKEKF